MSISMFAIVAMAATAARHEARNRYNQELICAPKAPLLLSFDRTCDQFQTLILLFGR